MTGAALCLAGAVIAVSSILATPHKYDSALAEWSRAPSRWHMRAIAAGVLIAALGAALIAGGR